MISGLSFMMANLILVKILKDADGIDGFFSTALWFTLIGNLALVASGVTGLIPFTNVAISAFNAIKGTKLYTKK